MGATAGLLLGGAVTAGLGWRWVFLVNVPVTAVLLVASPSVLVEPAATGHGRKTDVSGMVSFSAGTGLALYAISQVPALGWLDWRTCGLGLAGIAVLGLFARIQATTPYPALPSWLTHSRTLIAGNVTMLVAGMFVDGVLFVLTLLTQRAWGYSALQFGAVAAVMTATSVAASWLAQRAIARFGVRQVTVAGLTSLCLAGAVFAGTATASRGTAALLAGMVLFGVGMGSVFVAGSVAALQGVGDQDAGIASAVQTISFTAGSALGVAILSTVAALTTGYRAALVASVIIAAVGLAYVLAMMGRPHLRG
jgi:MFS family permease